MEEYKKRAEQAEKLLDSLEKRVKALEGCGGPSGNSKMDPNVKKQLRAAALEIKADAVKLEAENKRLKAELAKLKSGGSSVGSGDYAAALEKTKTKLKGIREMVQNLENENAELKKKVSGGGTSGTGLTADTKEYVRNKLKELRAEVKVLVDENERLKKSGGSKPSGPVVAQTFKTVVEGGEYTITKDFDLFKKSWLAAELTALDDDDYKMFLGSPITVLELEEDDETVEGRFENLETKWIPAVTLVGQAGQTAVAQGSDDESDDSDSDGGAQKGPSGPVWLTADSAKEGETYEITHDLGRLRKEWEAAEMGVIDDEDLMNWLGEGAKIMEIEEDDDTAEVCLTSSSENRWFPLAALCKPGTQGERKALPVLTYFNIFGRASKIRLALADNNVTYANTIIGAFGEKEKSNLMFGQLPVLQIGEQTFCQSNAILRHIGRRYFCYGEDEDLTDMCMEGIADWDQSYHKVIYTDKGSAQSKAEFLKAMKTKSGQGKGNCAQFANFNKILKNLFGPFIGGNKPGIADYYLFDLLYKLQRL
eukprot:UN25073